MTIEFKRWGDVRGGDWALVDGRILQVLRITPTTWDQSRNYYCSDGFNHERNINGWTAVTDQLPDGYKDPE